jgi:uncharacterized Zn finger protein (UPF0148 family)
MLGSHCENCGTVLLRGRDGVEVCIAKQLAGGCVEAGEEPEPEPEPTPTTSASNGVAGFTPSAEDRARGSTRFDGPREDVPEPLRPQSTDQQAARELQNKVTALLGSYLLKGCVATTQHLPIVPFVSEVPPNSTPRQVAQVSGAVLQGWLQ